MIKITLDNCCFNINPHKVLDSIFKLAEKKEFLIFWSDALIEDIFQNKKIDDLPLNKQISAKKRFDKAKLFPMIKSYMTFKESYNAFPIRFGNKDLNNQITNILFPNKKEKYDEVDVRHLFAHYCEKHDFFITDNRKDFINNGKRDKLEKELNIIIKTPEEFLIYWNNYDKI